MTCHRPPKCPGREGRSGSGPKSSLWGQRGPSVTQVGRPKATQAVGSLV